MRRSYALAASAVALALLAAVWSVIAADAAIRTVDVRDDEYVDSASSNSTTTIAVGDTVQWTWSGSNEHTVDNNGGTEAFSSGAPKTTGSFSHTFNAAGTFNYICGIHGTAMQGTVIVQVAQVPTATSTTQATTTPVPAASDTPAPGSTSTNTPAATSTAAPGTPSATPSTAAPQATAAASSALPATGAGAPGSSGRMEAVFAVALLATLAGIVTIAGASRWRGTRR